MTQSSGSADYREKRGHQIQSSCVPAPGQLILIAYPEALLAIPDQVLRSPLYAKPVAYQILIARKEKDSCGIGVPLMSQRCFLLDQKILTHFLQKVG